MRCIFAKYESVSDVYIPPRKNKQGCGFGFVRFFNITKAKIMEAKLSTILIGNQKLQVNIPKFDKGYQKEMERKNMRSSHPAMENKTRKGVSYAMQCQGEEIKYETVFRTKQGNQV